MYGTGQLGMKKFWVYNPHSGGVRIKPADQGRIRERILAYANKHYSGKFTRLDIRFRGALVYIDAFTEPHPPSKQLLKLRHETAEQYFEHMRNWPTHLCRLRHFSREDGWSVAFYTYSHERYEPCVLHTGSWTGTLEECFEIGATYLT
jgi:hypothetical protein